MATFRPSCRYFDTERSPQPVEAAGGSSRLKRGVTAIAVTEIILDQPQIIAMVGQHKPTGMAQHVGMEVT